MTSHSMPPGGGGSPVRQEIAEDASATDTPEGEKKLHSRFEAITETIKTILYAVLIAFVVRTFAYEPFNIPSGSMVPTLLVGDYLFVSKFSYGYSRHTIAFGLPAFEGRIAGASPERGDVVVFKLPRDNRTDYIKRVIGLPGDTIEMRRSRLYINGEIVPRSQVDVHVDSRGNRVRVFEETLPNGVSFLTLDYGVDGPLDNTGQYVVPDGHYFMMGDNRDNSQDSRVSGRVGVVPAANLVGRAEFLFFSMDGPLWQLWRYPWDVRWSRLFSPVGP